MIVVLFIKNTSLPHFPFQIFIFWVTDNFLMRHTRKKRLQMTRASSSFRQPPIGGGSSSGAGSGGILGVGVGSASIGSDHLQLPSSMMEPSLLQRVKYRTMRFMDGVEKQNESESEALISGDDDDLIIGAKGGGGGGGGGNGLGGSLGGVGLLGGVAGGGGGGILQRTTTQSIQMA